MKPTITVLINGQAHKRQEILDLEEKRSRVAGKKLGLQFTNETLSQMRQALLERKLELGHAGMQQCCQKDIALSSRIFKLLSSLSRGRLKTSQIEIEVQGLSAKAFLDWFEGRNEVADEAALLAAHPEHYIIASKDNRQWVYETAGGSPFVSEFIIDFNQKGDLVKDMLPDYPYQISGQALDKSGKPMGAALHQFKESSNGLHGLLTIYFPALVPKRIVEGHKRHLAIEFSNWIELAAKNNTGVKW